MWYSNFVFVVGTVLAQAVLTLRLGAHFIILRFRGNFRPRIYAVSMKNLPIVIGFGVITASQFVVGIYMMILTAKGGGNYEPLY